jgi:hypothetical protein
LELIKPLLLAANRVCIVVNTGANHPTNWVPQQNIIHLSLHHSFLCGVNGSYAAQGEKNKPAAVCSSFYDCGYMHLFSFVNEFTIAGGSVQYNYINKQKLNEELIFPELIQFLAENKSVKTLLSVYDSKMAAAFYKQLNGIDDANELNLFVSPLMLEQKAIAALNQGFQFSIQGYLPWHVSVPGNANTEFISTYLSNHKKEPSFFSLLGWETGIIISEILTANADDYRNADIVITSLLSKKINSPRGEMRLDEETLYYLSPAIRCTTPAGSTALNMEYDVQLESEWEEFSTKNTEGNISGWTNTYLCY